MSLVIRSVVPQARSTLSGRLHAASLSQRKSRGLAASTERPPRAPLSGAVGVKALPRLAAEMAGVDHFLEQGGWAVFGVVEAFVKDLHHRQHGVEPDEIGERQRADRMVATELHAGIDLFCGRNPLLQREDRLVDHWAKNAVDGK